MQGGDVDIKYEILYNTFGIAIDKAVVHPLYEGGNVYAVCYI